MKKSVKKTNDQTFQGTAPVSFFLCLLPCPTMSYHSSFLEVCWGFGSFRHYFSNVSLCFLRRWMWCPPRSWRSRSNEPWNSSRRPFGPAWRWSDRLDRLDWITRFAMRLSFGKGWLWRQFLGLLGRNRYGPDLNLQNNAKHIKKYSSWTVGHWTILKSFESVAVKVQHEQPLNGP